MGGVFKDRQGVSTRASAHPHTFNNPVVNSTMKYVSMVIGKR